MRAVQRTSTRENNEEGFQVPSQGKPCPLEASREVLEYVHRLLAQPVGEHPGLNTLLAEIAETYGASEAGLSLPGQLAPLACASSLAAGVVEQDRQGHRIQRGSTTIGPCLRDTGLLARLYHSASGIQVKGLERGSWLIAACAPSPGSALLWLHDDRRDRWDDCEAAALALVGQVLLRWLPGGVLPLQDSVCAEPGGVPSCECSHTGPDPAEPQARWTRQLEQALRQVRLEEAAQVADRLGHDFGDIFTGILGFTELALAQPISNKSKLPAYLREVHDSAQAGASLTHSLRLFSGRQVTSGTCRLSEPLAREVNRLKTSKRSDKGEWKSGECTVYTSLPDDLPFLAMDEGHLQQVLAEVLHNAQEALIGPGDINVSARVLELTESDCLDFYGNPQPGQHVEICVADTGAGLSPETQQLLFATPFFSTKPKHRGLGLSVIYGVLHAHKGGLRLYPAGDHGTVVRCVIPVARESSGAAGDPLSATHTVERNGEPDTGVDSTSARLPGTENAKQPEPTVIPFKVSGATRPPEPVQGDR